MMSSLVSGSFRLSSIDSMEVMMVSIFVVSYSPPVTDLRSEAVCLSLGRTAVTSSISPFLRW